MTVLSQETWRPVELYGGAIIAQFPERFVDVSDFRPVPDHQEVWADGASDQSIVVEIAEHSDVPDSNVGRFVFNDLAVANEASSSSIAGIRQLGAADAPHIPPETYMCLVSGSQQACKGRDAGEERSNTVQLLLCIIRLPQHGSDLLVTVNAPSYISPSSSAVQHADAQGQQPEAGRQAAAVMEGVLRSLKVQDWGLFGG
ncbi:hypothetical protein OEZ86_009880 [Tetradesmus obliquus]|uniref:Mog1p/PsbP-like protein n=1 Tax=Tetradesmus obliquus TaxID=3088 RepID=A0ABY8UNH1_TETOB|nr:hypothetical protein OEZ85_001317 [Tetradesmus obliquus]WIA43397.1 hypothetical protein OEZ86_009880 [Tetradesmus obliquus]